MNANAPVVLISGCSTGIGRALAVEFAARNWRVFATARRLEVINDLKAPNVNVSVLDVTDEKSIKACVNSVIAKAGRIDMLVNNAGLLLIGPLVELETSELRRQFETNVIGLAALTREVAPYIIKSKSGKIVNISSVSGVLPTPFAGTYCSTKAALTALSDSLRMELAPFGVKVITIQPGGIKTNLSDNADRELERFRKLLTVRYKILLLHGLTLRRKTRPLRKLSQKNSSINSNEKKRLISFASGKIRRCSLLLPSSPVRSPTRCSVKSSGLISLAQTKIKIMAIINIKSIISLT